MIQAIFSWVFAQWYHAFIAMFFFFNLLYWLGTFLSERLFSYLETNNSLVKVNNMAKYAGQEKIEMLQSMRSIFIFSLQAIFIQQGLAREWFSISYEFNAWFFLQVFLLFLWNEIHFYAVHRLLHTRMLMKHVHYVHHISKEPTVYATFSFHWLEAFLLGTVIFLPLLIFPFQALAILSLPILSLLINLLGHCNYDFYKKYPATHFKKFSYRHSMHHKLGRGNFGFLLPYLDNLFKTAKNE